MVKASGQLVAVEAQQIGAKNLEVRGPSTKIHNHVPPPPPPQCLPPLLSLSFLICPLTPFSTKNRKRSSKADEHPSFLVKLIFYPF